MTPFSASPELTLRMVNATLDDGQAAARRRALIKARRRQRRTQRVLTRY